MNSINNEDWWDFMNKKTLETLIFIVTFFFTTIIQQNFLTLNNLLQDFISWVLIFFIIYALLSIIGKHVIKYET